MPKVSICIPSYKQPECLRQALESIQKQSFKDYEVIITDDSPDKSIENLLETFHFQSNVKYIKNKKSLGSPENWNQSVRYATGEYIKILHHDDWFINEHSLGKYVTLLDEMPDADFGFSSSMVLISDSNQQWINKASLEKLEKLSQDPRCLFVGNFIGAPSCTIYRRTVEEIYDIKLKWVVDIDFYIRTLQQNHKFAFCEEPLVCISSGTEHQVTRECLNNKEVEVFEYLYLFNKIWTPQLKLKDYWLFLEHLFIKYEVSSYEEFKTIGVDSLRPEYWFRLLVIKSSYMTLRNKFMLYLRQKSLFKVAKKIFKYFQNSIKQIKN